MGAILPFAAKQSPGETPVDVAWREYQGLVERQLAQPDLGANLDHCVAMLRAHRKWADLFLSSEDAA